MRRLPDGTAERRVHIAVWVPESMARRWKRRARERDMTMSAWARAVIENAMLRQPTRPYELSEADLFLREAIMSDEVPPLKVVHRAVRAARKGAKRRPPGRLHNGRAT